MVVRLATLPPSCAVVMKSGDLNFLEPSGTLQACNGTTLPYNHTTSRNLRTEIGLLCTAIMEHLGHTAPIAVEGIRHSVTSARLSRQNFHCWNVGPSIPTGQEWLLDAYVMVVERNCDP